MRRAAIRRCGAGGVTNYIFPIGGGTGIVYPGDPRQPADKSTVITVYSRPESTKKWLEGLANRLVRSGLCPGPATLIVAVKITYDDIRGQQHRRYFSFSQDFETDSVLARVYQPKPFRWMQETPTHWKNHEYYVNPWDKNAIKTFGGVNHSLSEGELNKAASRILSNESVN